VRRKEEKERKCNSDLTDAKKRTVRLDATAD
jgi:hypothetical protein